MYERTDFFPSVIVSGCIYIYIYRHEDPLEKEVATHSNILAWRIPWTRSLVGYSPQGHEELDMTERLTHMKELTFSQVL